MVAGHLAALFPREARRDDEAQAGLIWIARVGGAIEALVTALLDTKKD
jgi:hypothetical protein